MKLIDPAAHPRADGGTDYRMPNCSDICYTRDQDSKIVASCTFCESRPGWVEKAIYCSDPDCKT